MDTMKPASHCTSLQSRPICDTQVLTLTIERKVVWPMNRVLPSETTFHALTLPLLPLNQISQALPLPVFGCGGGGGGGGCILLLGGAGGGAPGDWFFLQFRQRCVSALTKSGPIRSQCVGGVRLRASAQNIGVADLCVVRLLHKTHL